VRLADLALYASKERGRNGWSCNHPAPEDSAEELLKTAS
jgi:hypothetical protein